MKIRIFDRNSQFLQVSCMKIKISPTNDINFSLQSKVYQIVINYKYRKRKDNFLICPENRILK